VHSDEQAGGGILRQPNKGMQLTRPVQIAASQLIPRVGRTLLLLYPAE
jgi:hypothetical protein